MDRFRPRKHLTHFHNLFPRQLPDKTSACHLPPCCKRGFFCILHHYICNKWMGQSIRTFHLLNRSDEMWNFLLSWECLLRVVLMQDKWNMLCILCRTSEICYVFYAGQVKYVMYFMQDKWNMLCILCRTSEICYVFYAGQVKYAMYFSCLLWVL